MKKDRFSSTTQVRITSKKSIGQVDDHYYNLFFCEISKLYVCPGLMLCKIISHKFTK